MGYKGEDFEFLKFRSMVDDAGARLDDVLHLNEHDGEPFKIKNDPMFTRIGRVTPQYHVDEHPQLTGVVNGDLALVGPRPCLARELTMSGEADPSVHSKAGYHRSMTNACGPNLSWHDDVRSAPYYLDNWSFPLDLKIAACPVSVVLSGGG